MNTDPSAKTILCYGDSNTFGQRSDDVTKGRWPANIRWTGQLQQLLGEKYYLIEEGLSSRTTDLEYAAKPGRNGKTYLTPCLQSHHPIDLVVIMLGTNDLKIEFERRVDDIASAVSGLIDDVKQYAQAYGHNTKIMLVSPIHICDESTDFLRLYAGKYSAESVQKSHLLAPLFEQVAQAQSCAFFDAARVAEPGEDGIHLSRESHQALAAALSAQIQNILQ